MSMRRFLVTSLALAGALALGACGVDPTTVDARDSSAPAEAEPAVAPVAQPVAKEQVVTGRVVGVDRDGPSVEIVRSAVLTGVDATAAARAAGAIGPAEEWAEERFIWEGESRWIDVDPSAVVAVYDCTQACEHVAGTLEHVLTGAPYGGARALWTFVLGPDGRATAVEELYLP